ncbi:hypothetical protein DN826_06435 [Stutzerimonas nosocomialis]|uniref:DUF7673 family protein n=1 Tax=Stutzerimonas nosocomialis TaxID=1056496 RepID=UPI001109CEEF|nr:hypothetical protein [Stutzerimonas nosocomialis]TLX57867.1 hypothetical protein DN826_06435 [Stutzerimonas nosocomialis]
MATSIYEAMSQALAYQQRRPAIETAGVQALHRLTPIAGGHTGQSRAVGRFLLGLYNGEDFPFDLTDLRCLDLPVFEDCMCVLLMDYSPELEVHERVPNGFAIWDQLMAKWAPEVAQQ